MEKPKGLCEEIEPCAQGGESGALTPHVWKE